MSEKGRNIVGNKIGKEYKFYEENEIIFKQFQQKIEGNQKEKEITFFGQNAYFSYDRSKNEKNSTKPKDSFKKKAIFIKRNGRNLSKGIPAIFVFFKSYAKMVSC